jgi:hypothetical protein
MLEPESLHAMVIDEMTNEAFLVVRYFSYESDFERMNGLNWCMEGCPIQS